MSEALDVRSTRGPSRRVPFGELVAFVTSVLERAQAPLVAAVMPLPAAVDARALLRSGRGVDAWYFKSARGRAEVLGLGATRRQAAHGPDRFAVIERTTRRWLSELSVVHHEGAPRISPRAFVGFAFAPGGAAAEPWEPFGDAHAVLPRWTLFSADGDRAALVLIARPSTNTALVATELNELLAPPAPAPAPTPCARWVEHEAKDAHEQRVEAALSEIKRGALEKVVVARRSVVTSERDFVAADALDSLLEHGTRSGDETVYFLRRGSAALLGATPERLLAIRGTSLETEALAGTAQKPEVLLGSDKDRAEHRFVVESIERAIRPLTTRVSVGEPHVTPAGTLFHLRTKIEATLAAGTHPLAVAAALHPTSAVAGTPQREATEWIVRTEPGRGWYAGPIGWIDQTGEAELHVALRGGVIRGARAWAFSGGGIVRGSVPAAEVDETTLKMSAFLRALGVS